MKFYHTKCGGEVDVRKRQCLRCKKKWSPIAFKFDPIGIRASTEVRPKGVVAPQGSYESWANKLSSVPSFADKLVAKLPNWPKWARRLVTALVLAVVVFIIVKVNS